MCVHTECRSYTRYARNRVHARPVCIPAARADELCVAAYYYIPPGLYAHREVSEVPTAVAVGNLYGASAERIVLSVSRAASERARARGVIIAARGQTQWTDAANGHLLFARLSPVLSVCAIYRYGPRPSPPPAVVNRRHLSPRRRLGAQQVVYGFCTFLHRYPVITGGGVGREEGTALTAREQIKFRKLLAAARPFRLSAAFLTPLEILFFQFFFLRPHGPPLPTHTHGFSLFIYRFPSPCSLSLSRE